MFACLLSCVLKLYPVDFMPSPPENAVALGRKLYKSRAQLERTLTPDQVTLGSWFDGRTRRPVDTVTWLSPTMVARWLGFLAERDAWSDKMLSQRWAQARAELDGSLVFIVRL